MIFNLVIVGCIGILITIGYRREDIKVVSIGMSSLALLILVRYFDLFWRLLSGWIFFMVGGAVLIFGGIAFERKRRQLKVRFSR